MNTRNNNHPNYSAYERERSINLSLKYTLEGFQFSTEEEFKIAKEDYDAIQFFKDKLDMSDLPAVYKLYKRLIERNTFQTMVGYSFLRDLQNILIEDNYKTLDNLEKIHIKIMQNSTEKVEEISIEHYKNLAEDRRVKNRNSRIINILLVFTIIIMFFIALKADKTVFTQFEQDVVDKYSAWEVELSEWEEQLREKEAEINSSTE